MGVRLYTQPRGKVAERAISNNPKLQAKLETERYVQNETGSDIVVRQAMRNLKKPSKEEINLKLDAVSKKYKIDKEKLDLNKQGDVYTKKW